MGSEKELAKAMRQIIDERGKETLNDHFICAGLLNDLTGNEMPDEVRVIGKVIDAGVMEAFMQADLGPAMERLSHFLKDEEFMSEEKTRYFLDVFAEAFGYVQPVALEEEPAEPLSRESVLRTLRSAEEIFILYSRATNLPFVCCDEESYNDQVFLFKSEEGLKAYAKRLTDEKYLVYGMKYEKKVYGRLYGTLYAIDANSIVYHEGSQSFEIELAAVAKKADLSGIEEKKRPLFNESLELTGIYFMQELRRGIEMEKKTNLRSLEEEFLANLTRSSFLVPMGAKADEPGKVTVLYIKNKEGDVMLPVFSDVMELEKFTRGKQIRLIKVPFEKLAGLVGEQVKMLIINPNGINLPLNREQLNKLNEALSQVQA